MPLYEFHCDACDNDSEILVRSADTKGAKCPKCGSAKLRKQFSTFASSVAGATAPKATAAPRAHSCCGGGACSHRGARR